MKLTAKRLTYPVHIQILEERDDQGRRQYICPSSGCGDTAYLDEGDVGHCPSCEKVDELLARATAHLEPPVRPEWLG